jgi:hypothetical protein
MRDDPALYKDAESGHLDEAVLTAFVSGTAGPTRTAIVAHLADCAKCRHAVTSLSRALADPDVAGEIARLNAAPSRRRPLWIAALAAAALLFVLVNPFRNRASGPGGSTLRGRSEAVPAASIVSPADGQLVQVDGVSFIWRGLGGGVEYRITVTDEKGDVVWTRQSPDTMTRLDRAVLRPGRTYYWYVDALYPDGRSAAAAPRRFATIP